MILAHFIKRELETILYVPIFSPPSLCSLLTPDLYTVSPLPPLPLG